MPEELTREIRKLEIRLKTLQEKEEGFVEMLRRCLDRFRELNKDLEGLKTKAGPERVEELMNLRLEAIKGLCEALRKGSEAEHERSHFLESYGNLVLALEREFKDLVGRQ